MKNNIKEILIELKISDENSIVPYFPQVRDRKDVGVLKCKKSGVIFLSKTDHMDKAHYENISDFKYWDENNRKAVLLKNLADSERRYIHFKDSVINKKWLDIGTGAGGILDLLSPFAMSTLAVEPQDGSRNHLIELGYIVYPSIESLPCCDIQVSTLFHVFEHLTEPIGDLKKLKEKMVKGGKLIVEVPHANDFLLSFLNLEEFKSFTFWSEHLILHTRESLKLFLEAAGFSSVIVKGVQRYPLANHLHWLSERKPGGHLHWDI